MRLFLLEPHEDLQFAGALDFADRSHRRCFAKRFRQVSGTTGTTRGKVKGGSRIDHGRRRLGN